jgi:rod shape-determining protein MreD
MNKRGLLLFSVIFLSVIIQTTILPVYIIPQFKPDLLLICMVYLALRSPSVPAGAFIAWILGLLKDVFSALYFGMNAFSFLLIYLFIKHIADRLYAESSLLFVITITLAGFASVTLNFLLLLMFDQSSGIFYSMSAGLIPHLLVNAFAASLVGLIPKFDRGQETA